MTDSFEKLREIVMAEIQRQKMRADHPIDHARLLGRFLEACLTNLERTRADFAQALKIEEELADGILDGLLPVSEIDDEFLAEIAREVDYEPNLLRVMVGRSIKPASDVDQV